MAKALRCPGRGAAHFLDKPGCWAAPPSHSGRVCAGIEVHRAAPTVPGVSTVFTAAAHVLTHHVSAHWRYQKFQFFKAVSVFSVYMLDFIMVHGQKRFSTSHTQTLVRFLFLASLCFVGPTLTAILKYSAQPCHGRTPHPSQYRG